MWDQGDESLPPDTYVFVVIVRTVDGKVICSRAQTVHAELSRRADAGTYSRTGDITQCLRWRGDARQQQCQFIEASCQRCAAHGKCKDFILAEGAGAPSICPNKTAANVSVFD